VIRQIRLAGTTQVFLGRKQLNSLLKTSRVATAFHVLADCRGQSMSWLESNATAEGSSVLRGTQVLNRKQNILLVEDERLVREVAADILSAAGYRVWKAESAKEALEIFQQNSASVQLLITDVVLPDGRGPELAAKLQDLGGPVPTILISGYPERMIFGDLPRNAPFFYLPKPFSAEALTGKVGEILKPEAMAATAH
jgi:CheY-like chemotaxis protein